MTDKRLALTTAGSESEAHTIAEALVTRQLAACVNIVPKVLSVYRWEGDVEQSEEWLLLIKTTDALLDRVQAAVRELHSYELPEFLVLPIEGGSAAYLEWMASSVIEK